MCLSEGKQGVFIRGHTGCVYQRVERVCLSEGIQGVYQKAYRVCLSKGTQGVVIRG